jgi:peptidoglycan/xylan/chitin deacetylase (PgdA/CDA1 family)
MYHGIDSDQEPSELESPGDLVYVINARAFEAQMAHLTLQNKSILDAFDSGGCSATLSSGPGILITFDDGHISNFTHALPILERFGLKAVFFITTDWIGTPYYMTESMIRTLHDKGMIIGSHGKTHAFFSDLPDREILHELEESNGRLQAIIKHPVTLFSLPGGRDKRSVRDLAHRVGYTHVFTSHPGQAESAPGLTILGRYAMTRITSPDTFKQIAGGNLPAGALLRYRLLGFAKSLLGNTLYQSLRGRLMER